MKDSIQYYGGSQITFQDINGVWFANATEMAKTFNTRPGDWLRTDACTRYTNALSEAHKCTTADLVLIRKGGDNTQGTWMHEDLALAFAQWLSPEFYIWCNNRIKELLTKGSVSLPNFNNPAEAARSWADQYEQRELAEVKVKELQPKAESYDRFLDSDKYMTIADVAKTLHYEKAGPNQLFDILRKHGILSSQKGKNWNLPHQQYIDQKLFVVKKTEKEINGDVQYFSTPYVTAKGLERINIYLRRLGYKQVEL